MTKRVMAWSDGGSACEYYRLRVPLEHLASVDGDLDVKVDSIFQTFDQPHPLAPGLNKEMPPDVVVGQRINRDGPARLWRMLASSELGVRPKLVYELDDDLFNVPPNNPACSHFSKINVRENIVNSMAVADVITVSTEPLRDVVREQLWNFGATVKRIEVIPNALPDIAYGPPISERVDKHRIMIGWAGSSSHEEDFDEVAKPLGRLLWRNDDVHFTAVGHMFPRVAKRIPDGQRHLVPWQPTMEAYYQALDLFDIGIIPLRPSIFNRSKSDIKLLEYAARGIPVIASDAGPYSVHAGRVDLCGTEHDWAKALTEWVVIHRGSSFVGRDAELTELAYEYAQSRHVSSVADQWRQVIHG